MIKEVNRRAWHDEAATPQLEVIYECEYGLIFSRPKYRGGGWDGLECMAFSNAVDKYKELLKEDNKLIEV